MQKDKVAIPHQGLQKIPIQYSEGVLPMDLLQGSMVPDSNGVKIASVQCKCLGNCR